MRTIRTMVVGLAVAGSVVVGLGAGTAGATTKAAATTKASTSVVIGYEGFTESELMAYIYGDLLKSIGYSFTVKNAGGRTSAVPAIEKGALQVLPEYAGSLGVYLDSKGQTKVGTLAGAIALDNSKLNAKGVYALAGTSGLDQNDFVVTSATSKKYKLTTLSGLTKLAGKFTLAAPPECPTYYFCEPGLKAVYGVSFKSFKATDESGPVTVKALTSGEAQVAELFSTDPVIPEDHFVQLTDNKNLEPADHLIPLVTKSLHTSKVISVLAKANADLTTSALIGLENAISSGNSVQTVAAGFLATEKLVS